MWCQMRSSLTLHDPASQLPDLSIMGAAFLECTLQGGKTMAGYFKVVDAHDDGFRVKLNAPDGTLVALSAFFTISSPKRLP